MFSGTKLSEVYNSAVATVKEEKPELVEKLTKSAGFGTGIEFREGSLLIAGKTNVTVRKGQSKLIVGL